MNQARLFQLLWLSIAAAIATIALKTTAWLLTGSVGLLSDAAESVVNLVAAIVAMVALRWAVKPADDEHAYGHDKAEYFAAGVEGSLIVVAALTIMATALPRLLDPQPLDDVGHRRRHLGRGVRDQPRCRLAVAHDRAPRALDRPGGRRPPPADRRLDLGRRRARRRGGRADRLEPPRSADRAGGRREHRRHRRGTRPPLGRRPDGPRRSTRPTRRRSPRRWRRSPATASASTPCAPARPARAPSSPSTSSCRARGRSSAAMTSPRTSRPNSAAASPTPRSSPTSSRPRTPAPSPTPPSTEHKGTVPLG